METLNRQLEINSEDSIFLINEVDCYIGNAYYFEGYETDRSVQHQLLLKENQQVIEKWILTPSDSDRGSRIAGEILSTDKSVKLWKENIIISEKMKTECCRSKEEYDINFNFNKSFRKQHTDNLIEIFKELKLKETVTLKSFLYATSV